MHVGNMTA